MILTIWRHGEAGPAATDRERQLTEVGMADVERGARQFRSTLLARGMQPPGLILFSPWVRTRETAAILGSAMPGAGCRQFDALRPGATVAAALTALSESGLDHATSAADHVLIVSHQPLVSRLVDYLLGEPGRAPLSPGAMACLDNFALSSACSTLAFWAGPPAYRADL